MIINISGTCACCNGNNLEYNAFELHDGCGCYPVKCLDCGAVGKEWYNLDFTETDMEGVK